MDRRVRRNRGEEGEAVIETVILFPALVLAIMVVIQFALWYTSQELVRAAADEGVRVARQEQASGQEGADRANRFLSQYASPMAVGMSVTADKTDTSARVTVDGSLVAIVPFLNLPLHAAVESPVERFYGAGS